MYLTFHDGVVVFSCYVRNHLLDRGGQGQRERAWAENDGAIRINCSRHGAKIKWTRRRSSIWAASTHGIGQSIADKTRCSSYRWVEHGCVGARISEYWWQVEAIWVSFISFSDWTRVRRIKESCALRAIKVKWHKVQNYHDPWRAEKLKSTRDTRRKLGENLLSFQITFLGAYFRMPQFEWTTSGKVFICARDVALAKASPAGVTAAQVHNLPGRGWHLIKIIYMHAMRCNINLWNSTACELRESDEMMKSATRLLAGSANRPIHCTLWAFIVFLWSVHILRYMLLCTVGNIFRTNFSRSSSGFILWKFVLGTVIH